MADYIQVSTTTENKDDAKKIARELVQKRLAACVQTVGPILSTYWWEDKVNEEEEWLLIIKTGNKMYGEVEEVIKEMHPYEIPEIIASPVIKGSKDYLEWLEKVIILSD
ncbi:divalent-cation tolerance protein CutA [Thermodesulfobacteriota bacterium]